MHEEEQEREQEPWDREPVKKSCVETQSQSVLLVVKLYQLIQVIGEREEKSKLASLHLCLRPVISRRTLVLRGGGGAPSERAEGKMGSQQFGLVTGMRICGEMTKERGSSAIS